MTADPWDIYDRLKEYIGDGTIDLDGHKFKMQLHTSSHVPAQTDSRLADLDNEHAQQYGYTTGGQTLTSVTWTRSGETITFDSADPKWTASGGNIVCRYAIVYDDSATNDELVCCGLLDNTPQDVTVSTGNTLTVQIHTNGYFRLDGGWT